MRRLLLLTIVLGSQFATGCYCYRPYLPRLQAGFGCGTGTCGTPLIDRPILDRPILDRPILRPYAVYPYATPPAVAPDYGVSGGSFGVGSYPMTAPATPGCSGCGASASSGYPNVATAYPPTGYPTTGYPTTGYPNTMIPPGAYANPPAGYPGMSSTPAPAPMPQVMPSAMPGGVPHDSALLKMPTIMPPSTGSKSQRPEQLARDLANPKS